MSNPPAGEPLGAADEPPTPETAAAAASMVGRARSLMIISGLTTMIAIAAVIGAIGYRVFRSGGSGATTAVEAVAVLPKGARVIATAVADDRVIVTLDVAGAAEIRTFDVKTLKETGRIRFAAEP
jgi:hypothetical protein